MCKDGSSLKFSTFENEKLLNVLRTTPKTGRKVNYTCRTRFGGDFARIPADYKNEIRVPATATVAFSQNVMVRIQISL